MNLIPVTDGLYRTNGNLTQKQLDYPFLLFVFPLIAHKLIARSFSGKMLQAQQLWKNDSDFWPMCLHQNVLIQ